MKKLPPKKLKLSTETVVVLSEPALREVAGGLTLGSCVLICYSNNGGGCSPTVNPQCYTHTSIGGVCPGPTAKC